MTALDIFCRVIDNYGDIGVCWRLARQLRHEHGWRVRLWVDVLPTLARLCPQTRMVDCQLVDGVEVHHWRDPLPAPEDIGDLVIAAFGCHLPDSWLQAMTARQPRATWINLEYLSAEDWVEGCHGLPSTHPSLGLREWFFFPGFTASTGGLLLEQDLPRQRAAFAADAAAQAAFLHGLGVQRAPCVRLLTLFCYPQAPLASLFAMLEAQAQPTLCLVAEGVASDAVAAWLGTTPVAGARAARGNLQLQVVPFLRQPDYDRLLWCADLNFVRGEDSFVRAQWAERPLLWHIYPQAQEAHLKKLDAFLNRYCQHMALEQALALKRAMHGWNGAGIAPEDWSDLWKAGSGPSLEMHAAQWAASLRQHGDLASNLLRFAQESC